MSEAPKLVTKEAADAAEVAEMLEQIREDCAEMKPHAILIVLAVREKGNVETLKTKMLGHANTLLGMTTRAAYLINQDIDEIFNR